VVFLGFVENMPAFFKSLDIFLLTSRYEGFSNVIPEAMASRVPVITFDVKSTSEIIEQGKTGYIVEQKNMQQMVDRVLELAGDRGLRERVGMNGRKRAEELFSFEKNQEKILDLVARSNGR
jgi:glycosyltransferase involved in cell wall biosynthesis